MGSPSNGHRRLPADEARELIGRGIAVVPIPYGQKNPVLKDWKNYTLDVADVERVFPARSNVGMILGERSGGLADADLDAPEAVRAAAFYLPRTDMIWGRDGKPRSHFGYMLEATDGAREIKLKDATGAMLCELRYTGQTIAPGSTNTADGYDDKVRYEPDGHGLPSAVAFDALKRALERIAATAMIARLWAKGGRHTLVLPLAGLFWYGGVPLDDAVRFVEVVCSVCGETEQETIDRLTVVRGTYANAQAGTLVTGGATLEDEVGTKVVDNLRKWLNLRRTISTGGYTLDDTGNSQRFIDAHGDTYRYNHTAKTWLHWDGRYWKPNDKDDARHDAKDIAPAIFREAIALPAGAAQDAMLRWAKSSGMEQHITKLLRLAESDPRIAVVQGDLDANPMLLAFPNGYLDLATGEFSPPIKDALVTRLCACAYDPAARSAEWDETVRRFIPDPDTRRDFFTAVGYCLTGRGKEHMFIPHGRAKRGKSTVMAAIANAMGDYATTVGLESFATGKFDGGGSAREDLVALVGRRLVIASEATEFQRLSPSVLKRMLGGTDKMSIRGLYGKQFSVLPTFGLWILTNFEPRLPADDDAIWERTHVFSFDQYIPPEERNEQTRDKIVDPAVTGSAVLNDVIAGWRRYYNDLNEKLVLPTTVKETAAYHDEQDAIGRFIEECCKEGPDEHCSFGMFKTRFREWAKESGIREQYSDTRIGRALADRGYEERVSRENGVLTRTRRGVSVNWQFASFDE